MKSPFPGMDPYLESRWGDLHLSLIAFTRSQLRPQLSKDLRARAEENIVVENEEDDTVSAPWKPDVRVIERPDGTTPSTAMEGGVALVEPLVLEWEYDPEIQRSIRIIDVSDGSRVITVIEFFSPTNKTDSRDRKRYRRKQRDLIDGGVNLVEIDLIRQGAYLMAVPRSIIPRDYLGQYGVCVTRGGEPSKAELYRIELRSQLPAFRIPLRETDRDVQLDLQALLEKAYEEGGNNDIDYTKEANPPLTGEDAKWADALLRKQGKR